MLKNYNENIKNVKAFWDFKIKAKIPRSYNIRGEKLHTKMMLIKQQFRETSMNMIRLKLTKNFIKIMT